MVHPRHFGLILSVATALLFQPADAQTPAASPAPGVLGRGAESLFAPAQAMAVAELSATGETKIVALRGLLVKTARGWLCYDTDLPGVAAEWTDVSFDLSKTNFATYKGLEHGAILVKGHRLPMEAPVIPAGTKWKGLYVHGPVVTVATTYQGKETLTVLNEKADARTLKAFVSGGPPIWPIPITVTGTRAPDDAGYVVDQIPLPEDNPWKCWLRPTGIDFFPDGRVALCTLGGDVWVGSGLNADLKEVRWQRVAGGLREPMGLRIVEGKIVVGGRDQITRLHDLNGDGETDYYECVNAGRQLLPNFHAFAYDLQTDRAGNFYYVTGGNQLGENEPWHGQLYRVSPDGAQLNAVAKGFRAPNGLTIGPDDAMYVAENQGQWIPSSKISRIKAGGFYGFVADPKAAPKAKAPPAFDPPVCYLPMAWDNSSGGGAVAPLERWGPFGGRFIHTSFGAATLFAVLEQRVGDIAQGAAIKFPCKTFLSGIHRARFNPQDGQLYVCGTKGWQSRGVQDGCLARVRYTGQPVHRPIGWRVAKDALIIDFPAPLDPATATDPENYGLEGWNYLWHATYGSPDVSLRDPKKRGRDRLEIPSARLSADGRTVTLDLPGLTPMMQWLLKLNIKAADGTVIDTEMAGTINVVPQ